MVTLQKSDLGRGPRFSVADPGVRYRGPLRSPILTVQALVKSPVLGLQRAFENFEKTFEINIENLKNIYNAWTVKIGERSGSR